MADSDEEVSVRRLYRRQSPPQQQRARSASAAHVKQEASTGAGRQRKGPVARQAAAGGNADKGDDSHSDASDEVVLQCQNRSLEHPRVLNGR